MNCSTAKWEEGGGGGGPACTGYIFTWQHTYTPTTLGGAFPVEASPNPQNGGFICTFYNSPNNATSKLESQWHLAQPGVLIALVKAGQLTSQDQGIVPVLATTAPHRDLFQSKQEGWVSDHGLSSHVIPSSSYTAFLGKVPW